MTVRLAPSIPRTSADDPHAVHRINLSWLVRLRWGAILGQGAVIGYTAWGLAMHLPLAGLAAILGVEAAVNAGVSVWLRRRPAVTEPAIACSLAVDVTCFTGLLYLTGGPMNPFSFLYLVHIALAALVLRPRWAWALVLLSLAGSAALFVQHVPLPEEMHGGHSAHAGHAHHAHHPDHQMPPGGAQGQPFDLHLKGMWVAFAVAAAFIVYFINRVMRALREREGELVLARELSARTEKLAAMATLAAGAAHELGTPLATIAVVARELERAAPMERCLGDARLIREQVERCRGILSQMAEGAAAGPGEAAARTTLGELVRTTLSGLQQPDRVRLEWPEGDGAREATAQVPVRALSQALRNLVKNGLDASPDDRDVTFRTSTMGESVRFEIQDAGSGMTPDVLARAAEPFFTTKDPGSGMGLGLFLTRSVVELLGGTLDIASAPGQGTRVVVELPWASRDNAPHGEGTAS